VALGARPRLRDLAAALCRLQDAVIVAVTGVLLMQVTVYQVVDASARMPARPTALGEVNHRVGVLPALSSTSPSLVRPCR
jgi:hypothetical protein